MEQLAERVSVERLAERLPVVWSVERVPVERLAERLPVVRSVERTPRLSGRRSELLLGQ